MDNSTSERPAFLSTEAAEPRTYRLAKAVALISLLVFIAAVPFVRVPLPESRAFIASYESALAINDLVTASLLAAQFFIMRSRALLVLACGYLFTAAIVIPHALTFPGVFAAKGLLGAGTQTTIWLYLIWHAGFPLFVMAYALLKNSENRAPCVSSRGMIISSVIAVLTTVCVLTLIATAGDHFLPVIIVDERFTPMFSMIAASTWVLSLAALVLLLSRRPYTVLDVWLAVTMCAWLCDISLSAVLDAGRFDLGYYAGRLFGLLASTFVLLMLLRETVVLYARVVRLLEAEQQERRRDVAERRRLFETSLDLILVVDRKGVIGRVNPSCMPILGYTPEEMMGHRTVEFLFAADRGATRVEMHKVLSGEIMRNFHCRYVRKDGVLVTLAWTGLWSEPDQLYFFFGRDMTEQKLTEKKFQLAVESCPNGMLMSDAEGIIQLVNAEAEQMFGYPREELIGKSVDILVPPALRGKQTQYRIGYMAHSEAGLSRKEHELSGLRKDGVEFPIELALNSIQSPEGLLVLSVVIDVTERKRIERLKDEFVSTVSHELRTPLTSIAASLGLLARNAKTQLPESVARLITIAHSNSQRLVRLVNDILDIEKIESGKMAFNIVRVDMRRLVEQAIDASQGFAHDYGISLRLDPGSKTGDVAADSDRLTQILTNLISNAVKFSPRGQDVVVAIEATDANVRVSVRDHGPGIPEEFKPRIFEKFAQADATDTRQKGGTGLGLSIVQQLAAKLGGEVGFEDAPGGGTIFYLDLPRLEAQVTRNFPQGGEQGGPHILICDDYPLAANLLAEQLGTVGFICDIATTGREATERAQTVHYAAILIDLQLPDCDGISLIQQLRAQPQNAGTQIIVVSGNPERGRSDTRSSSLDVLDWLQKPVDIERLTRLIAQPNTNDANRRLRILHLDDDLDVLRFVSHSLAPTADMVSVDSVEKARRALATGHFDLAIIDIALASGSGLDLLPDLHDQKGNAVPVILMSAKGANPTCAAQVQAALIKSQASVDQLVATLRRCVPSQDSAPLKSALRK